MAEFKSTSAKTLSDADRYKRFVGIAKEVGASEDPKDFDKAFKAVTKRPKRRD